ncbi:hypothetical protein LTR78_008811 [Recurvomyces mirabilis]|uniref:Uncharacterized protein n=1 Tax=Recurvomyces mirabilis TaxID=574656 RepID=A0AAE0WHL3_9PEZI|nr:hypothetical protein LTR78_008811 [Recurvomyces mirabilis]KAK5160952.1 hypothetical protein LTS14_000745 [Recurvomyces mirabilis]
MPARKETKEAVVYPASKRKAPPFKPLSRPAKVPRLPTTEESEGSTKAIAQAGRRLGDNKNDGDDDDDDDGREGDDAVVGAGGSGARASKTVVDSDEELEDDPLTARPFPQEEKKRPLSTKAKPSLANRPPARRPDRPAVSILSQSEPASTPPPPPSTKLTAGLNNTVSPPPPPTPLPDDPTQLPQPLLTRLLHESFVSSTTKLDKHALQILQKYMEIFVREGIARTALAKREKGESGEVEGDEVRWLEVGDLEEVAAGMMMDF